jgi:hypothetical protein
VIHLESSSEYHQQFAENGERFQAILTQNHPFAVTLLFFFAQVALLVYTNNAGIQQNIWTCAVGKSLSVQTPE